MDQEQQTSIGSHRDGSRRGFLCDSSLLLAGAMPGGFHAAAQSAPSPAHRIGLIGCGKFGMRLASQLLTQNRNAKIVALADLFNDRTQQTVRALNGRFPSQFVAARGNLFTGLDAFRSVVESDIDVVVLAASPLFRPAHAEYAIVHRRQVIAALPLGTDAVGLLRSAAVAREASDNSIDFVVAIDRQRQRAIDQSIAQVQSGKIGELIYLRTSSNSTTQKPRSCGKKASALEIALRNWRSYDGLSGSGLLEEHAYQLDACHRLLSDLPASARGIAARVHSSDRLPSGQTGITNAKNLASASVEFEFPRGQHVHSLWRCSDRHVSGPQIAAYGSEGWCDVLAGSIYDRNKRLIWSEKQSDANASPTNPRMPGPIFEFQPAQRFIDSNLAAILGRTAALLDRPVSWDECLRDEQPFGIDDPLQQLSAS